MTTEDKLVKTRKEVIDCVCSLQKAIHDAGGGPLTAIQMNGLTLERFITTIAAQNHIRFYHNDPEKSNQYF